MRLGVGFAILGVASLTSGCLLGDSPPPLVGVMPKEDGGLNVEYACTETLVQDIQLRRLRGEGGGDTGPGVVIWRVVSTEGERIDNVTIGRTPEGFVESVPLDEPLSDDRQYRLRLRSSKHRGIDVNFEPDGLAQGQVRVYFGNIDRDEFENQNLDC